MNDWDGQPIAGLVVSLAVPHCISHDCPLSRDAGKVRVTLILNRQTALLPLYLIVCVPHCLCISLSVCLAVSYCLGISLSVRLTASLSHCLCASLCLTASVSHCLCALLPRYLTVCVSLCLTASVSHCLCASLYPSTYFFSNGSSQTLIVAHVAIGTSTISC